MILEYIRLKNFMAISEAELSFSSDDNNLILIKGENGVGKSAVFNAIAFAVLGLRKGNSAKQFIKRGEKEFEIDLNMRAHAEGDLYEIRIVCGHKSMPPVKKEITYQGNIYKNSEFETFIKKEFDLPLLEAVVFTMQGDNNITKFRPSQLRELLKQVFHISFDQEHDEVVKMARQLQDRLTSTNSGIQSFERTLSILTQSNNDLVTRPPSKALLEVEKGQAKILEDTYIRIKENTSSIKQLEDAITQKKDLYKTTVDVIDQTMEEYNKILDAIVKQKTFLSNAEEFLAAQEQYGLEANKETIASSISDLMTTKFNKQIKLKEAERNNELAQEDICHTCGQTLPSDIINKKDEFPLIIAELKKELKQIEISIKSHNDTIMIIETNERTKAKTLYEIESYNKNIKALEENAEFKLSASWYKKLVEQEKTLKVEIKELNNKLNNLLSDEIIRKELEQEIELEKKIQEKYDKIQEMEKQITSYEAQKKLKEDLNSKRKSIEDELEGLKRSIVDIEKESELYIAAQRLLEKYLPTYGILIAGEKVIKRMSRIIQPVFPNWEMRLVPSRDGVDFEYRIEGEQEFSSISMASGFESALCSIAFKMALTAYYQFPILFLDEVDAYSSTENSKILYDNIYRFVVDHDIKQCWIISHKQDVSENLVATKEDDGVAIVIYEVKDGTVNQVY